MRGVETIALVAAWTPAQVKRRSDFRDRLTGFAGNLPPGSVLQVRIRPSGSARLTLGFVVLGAGQGEASVLARLTTLLADEGSPVVVAPASATDSATAETPLHLSELRRTVFAQTRLARRRAMSLSPGPSGSVEALCAALVGSAPGHEVRVSLAPQARGGLREEDVAVALGISDASPDAVCQAFLRSGALLRCQVLVATPGEEPDPWVASELAGLASPLELAAVSGRRRDVANMVWAGGPPSPIHEHADELQLVMGAKLVSSLLPLPVATSGTFPGFLVVPAGVVRASLSITQANGAAGIRLGHAVDASGSQVPIQLGLPDLSRHVYIPGQTGAGKSTALRATAVELARSGNGLLFVDPHGETARLLLSELPAQRADDVVFVDCADPAHPAPINPFAVSDPLQRDAVLANVAAMFMDLFDPLQQGIVGPRWETWFRMGMLTLIAAHGERASFLDVPRLFLNQKYLDACLPAVDDEILRDFWDEEMRQTNSHTKSELLGWFNSKFTPFRMNAILRSTLGSGHDVLDPVDTMDAGKIVIVSLEKGLLGASVSQLLGYVYLTRFWTAALRRREGKLFGLLVDEAHTFSRGPLPDVLAEGRKFGLAAVIANQYLEQFPERVRSAILGNVGTVIAFRLGERDAETLGGRFAPEFESPALRRAPNYVAACSLLVEGAPAPAFSLVMDHVHRQSGRSDQERTRQTGRIVKSSRAFLREAARTVRVLDAEKRSGRTGAEQQTYEERAENVARRRARVVKSGAVTADTPKVGARSLTEEIDADVSSLAPQLRAKHKKGGKT